MDDELLAVARRAVAGSGTRPVYLRLADALALAIEGGDGAPLPSGRALAARLGINRATATAALRELARRGLAELRRGRPARRPAAAADTHAVATPPRGSADLARYAPDRELIPEGRVFAWLGLGEGEGETVAQYGDPRGYTPLREWLTAYLTGHGVGAEDPRLLLTGGVQHGLDLLLRALAEPGDEVIVEDPTYPGLPPLLAEHRLRPVPLRVHLEGVDPDDLVGILRGRAPRLAIVTPTLQNPSGTVMDASRRSRLLRLLSEAGVLVVEEFFDPRLIAVGEVPAPLAAADPGVVMVGSFSKALFPGLRVGWLCGPEPVVRAVAAVKRATDLSGSTFLEAAAWSLCRQGVLDRQLGRLRSAAMRRARVVLDGLGGAPADLRWSTPRGGFSLLVELAPGMSSAAVAAAAVRRGVWVLPGSAISVSGRDDIVRLAFAAVGGERLSAAVRTLVEAMAGRHESVALV